MPSLPDLCPFAEWTPYSAWPTGRYTDTQHYKVVWHKTVGSGASALAWYNTSGGIPKFTIVEDGTIHQHYSMNRYDRALRNQSGGVQTNLDGAISIEIAGHPGKEVTKAQRNSITKLSTWFTELGIPARWLNGAPVKGSRGRRRLSQLAWDNGSGHCGHVDVPENDHYDPEFTAATLAAVVAGWDSMDEGEVVMSTPRAEWYKLYNASEPGEYSAVVEEIQDFFKHAAVGPDGKLKRYYGFTTDGMRHGITDAAMRNWKADTFGYENPSDKLGRRGWDELNRQLFMVHVSPPVMPHPGPGEDCEELEADLDAMTERATAAEAENADLDAIIESQETEIAGLESTVAEAKNALGCA